MAIAMHNLPFSKPHILSNTNQIHNWTLFETQCILFKSVRGICIIFFVNKTVKNERLEKMRKGKKKIGENQKYIVV